MIRPMTSDVSALSGFVAKWSPGHAFVSSAPSKIPYGGFSPGTAPNGLSAATFVAPATYTLPQRRISSVSV